MQNKEQLAISVGLSAFMISLASMLAIGLIGAGLHYRDEDYNQPLPFEE